MNRRRASWSELYPELLFKISGLLQTRPDIHNFRAVCKNWCSSVSLEETTKVPLIKQIFPVVKKSVHVNLLSNAVYLIRPRNKNNYPNSNPFLVTVEEFNKGKLRLFYTLTRNQVDVEQTNVSTSFSLSDFHVSLVASGFILTIRGQAYKVISFSNSVVSFESVGDDKDNDYDNNDSSKPVCVCIRPGGNVSMSASYHRTALLANKDSRSFDDIDFFKRMIYVIDSSGRAYTVSDGLKFKRGHDLLSSEISGAKCIVSDSCGSCDNNNWRKRLVIDYSFDVLYLVVRVKYTAEAYERLCLKVYKLNEESGKWDQVSSLVNDTVLFISVDLCFFASAADFPGCRGNCIVFQKDSFTSNGGRSSFQESLLRGATKELEIVVFHLEDGEARLLSAYPGFADVLWPPPSWFLQPAQL